MSTLAQAVTTSPSRWQPLIQAAASEDAVVDLVKEYLASWTPEEIDSLPRGCRPGQINNREDVSEWAVVLTREELKSGADAASGRMLNHLSTTFREAAARLSQLSTENRLLGPRSRS